MLKTKRIKELKKLYPKVKRQIQARLDEFARIWESGKDKEIFIELVFCMLTPQSKAKACWRSVQALLETRAIYEDGPKKISGTLCGVRFHNNKAKYIVGARKLFSHNGKFEIRDKIPAQGSTRPARDWFVKNVKGFGYKEASHFLRNIGRGEDLAILDRHILKNLKSLGVIRSIPKSLTRKKYLEIEDKMERFSKKIDIPMGHLDLLLWYKETGEVFK